jgi:hypothetical protein
MDREFARSALELLRKSTTGGAEAAPIPKFRCYFRCCAIVVEAAAESRVEGARLVACRNRAYVTESAAATARQ